MKRNILFLGIGVGSLILMCWGITTQTLLLKCQSDSLLNTNYLLVWQGKAFERGDIVYIKDHRVKYVSRGTGLAKRVLGLPGDVIERGDRELRLIHGSKIASPLFFPLLKETRRGETLTPLSSLTIPEGYVFVAGDHVSSFDSRYGEFGLVPIEKIKGRAVWWW